MRSLAAVAIGVMLVLATPAAPLPPPDMGDDDAGSGGDAGDRQETATPIEAGTTYTGRVGWDIRQRIDEETTNAFVGVSWEYDQQDVYRFEVPGNTTIRARISVPETDFGNETSLRFSLTGPNGRSLSWFLAGPNRTNVPSNTSNVSAIAVRPGTWYLTIRDDYTPGPVPYGFAVVFDRFEHGLVLDGGGEQVAAWEVTFPEGVRGRMDHWLDPPFNEDGLGDAQAYGTSFSHVPAWDACGFAIKSSESSTLDERLGRTGLDRSTVGWTKGPADANASGPVDVTGQLSLRDGWTWGFWDEAPPLSDRPIRVGVAHQHGVDEVAYVVWDGPVPPVIDRKDARAEFLALEDFEADGEDGFGAQVGPVAYAEVLSLVRGVPDRPGNVIYVDANPPQVHAPYGPVPMGLHAPTVNVSLPNGSVQTVHDRWFFWEPLPRSFPWRGDQHVPPGTWRFDLDHVDGVEGDQVRVMLLSFGFPFDCD